MEGGGTKFLSIHFDKRTDRTSTLSVYRVGNGAKLPTGGYLLHLTQEMQHSFELRASQE